MRTRNREFLAADVYRAWKRRVQSAKGSVWVFTPYFDQLLVHLLGNTDLVPADLCVVTDLSPASGATAYRRQLLATLKLLEAGIEVRSLPRLHAKILLIDGSHVSLGSQNFTSYAKQSKEVTAVPIEDLSDTRMVATLKQWYAESELVDLEWVEQLLSQLGKEIREFLAAHEALVAAFLRVEAERKAEEAARTLRQSMRQRIRLASQSSRFRTAQSTAWAQLQWEPGGGGYRTLLARGNEDLTYWWGPDFETVTLGQGHFYPALLGPLGRMAFVRVTQSRITYVWRGITWGGSVSVGGEEYWLSANFPNHGTEESNIHLKLQQSPRAGGGYDMDLRFDGHEIEVVDPGSIFGNPWNEDEFSFAVEGLMDDEDDLSELLAEVLSPAPNPRNFRNNPNADTFFEDGWHRIGLTECLGQSVLLVEPE